MRGRSLAVLMWKHLMVRKRRYINTAIELFTTIMFILVLFLLRNRLKPPLPTSLRGMNNMIKMTAITPTESGICLDPQEVKVLGDRDMPTPRFLLYTPDTKLAGTLMDEVGRQLGLRRLADLPNKSIDGHYKGYYPFSNLSEITDFVQNIYTNEAIIIFEDMEGEDWSDRKRDQLTYTIRIQNSFYTNSYKSQDDVPRDHEGFGDDYDEFIRLQWAIDTSFIKVRTGNTVPQNLTLQEFPYYRSGHSEIMKAICTIMPFISWMSLDMPFIFLMSRLMEERASGIQELIKMVGVSSSTIGLSHFLNALPCGLVYSGIGTVLLKGSSNPLIDHSSGVVMFIGAFLHFLTVAAIAMAASYLARSTQYATSIAVMAYILAFVPYRVMLSHWPSGMLLQLCGIFPHVPNAWLWTEIAYFEQYNYGLTFADITTSHTPTSGPVLLGFGWMVVQCTIFFTLAGYLSQVCPGKYGQALPWNFFCQKQYWTRNEIKPDSELKMGEEEQIARDMKYFEDPPNNADVGIKVENISKNFPKHKALSNVSLEVYKGEIMILLGHNGAGKTTLMSIITGMMTATAGKVFVNGMDAVKQRDQVRSHLGLCPQHNLFFADLTVQQHVIFFTLLKGGSYSEACSSSRALLDRLGISGKASSQSSELSGGMKRRLQLACALAGGSNVLILDEPTSGLDVETRRELWDLLLSLRGERTVLLTTHFMEEADALGDRVAALHLGQLRCHATPMYLKKAIGTGYRLSFTTNGAPKDEEITSVVTSFVPDASIKEKTINSLSYNLPATASAKFPTLFTSLEERRSELGIATIGVGVSTLEEVFIKLCSDTDTTSSEDEIDTGRIEPTFNKVTGTSLYRRQFAVLFKRQWKYVMSRKLSFLILQIILPISMLFMFTYICNNTDTNDTSQPSVAMNLDLYEPMRETKVLYKVNSTGAALRALDDKYPRVMFGHSDNITDVVLRTGIRNILEYNKYLVGIELNDTNAKALYTTVYRHAAPVATNLLTNLIASQYLPGSNGQAITTYNHPIDSAVKFNDPLKQAKSREVCMTWTGLIVFIILASNINFASLPCRERASGSRHLHMMAGCPPALMWLCTLTFHALTALLLLVAPTAVACATVDADSTLTQPHFILSLMLILFLGSLSFFAFMYLATFYFSERVTGILMVTAMVIFGLVTTTVKTLIGMFEEKVNILWRMSLALVSYTMPPHALVIAVSKCVNVARLNALCTLNRARCPALTVKEAGFDSAKCCAGENPGKYLAIGEYSPGAEMIFLSAQCIVYMILVVLTQKGIFKCICDRIVNMNLRNKETVPGRDEIVRAEAIYVSKEIALPKKQIEEAQLAMLVNDVHKNYCNCTRKSSYAVQGLSFSVKKGECFGLLGVNGAGKSTTFKMLTAEECATKGSIYANGHYLDKDKVQYLRSLGYCPQFFGLDDFQSGRDNLTLLLTLRGLDAEEVRAEVKSWIDIVGLEQYSNRLVSGYSGGCTRRLGAAAALSSGAPITLLDEPTAGVDVAARRRVWSALRRSLRLQRSVVITSHSMDEMEALCSRVGIMSGGVLRALGTPAELRASHAQGHAVVIKLTHAKGDEVDSGAVSEIDNLKSSLHSKFNCTLKDEHKTMLHYHINETMRYSELFSELENLRSTYPSLIEDYSVTETTLEEVFLSFAKENQNNTPPARTQNGIV